MKIIFVGEKINEINSGIITVMKQLLKSKHLKKNIQYQPIYTTGSFFPLYKKLSNWSRAYVKFIINISSADAIHIHYASNLNFWLSSGLVYVANFFKIKVLFHNHAGDFQSFYESCSAFKKNIIIKTFRTATINIIVSDSWLKWYNCIAPSANWKVLKNSIELPDNIIEKTLTDNEIILIYMGRLEHKKGFFNLINIMPIIIKNIPNCTLHIAGHGDFISLKNILADKGITKHVSIMGHINSDQRDTLLRKAHMIILPSFHEGLPMVLLEAMAYGVVPVTTPVGGIPELVIDGYNGSLVTPGNEEELLRGISSILLNETHYKELSTRAKDKIAKEFSLTNYQEKLLSIYSSLEQN